MRRFGGLNVSSKVNKPQPSECDARGRSQSPKGIREWRAAPNESSVSARDLGRFLSPSANSEAVAQDAAILQSVWGDDVKIRQGIALLKPSEIRNRTPGKRRQKDWGECPLTFDSIREPVRAGDGKVYERWAIAKWLEENGNRSPLTNVVIDPTLVPLTDSDEGLVKGERFVRSPGDRTGIKTEINTVLNAARSNVELDEDFTDIPDFATPQTAAQAGAISAAAPINTPHREEALRTSSSGSSNSNSNVAARNREIAAIMRDSSIPPAQKQSRIQAILSGNAHAPAAAAEAPARAAPASVSTGVNGSSQHGLPPTHTSQQRGGG
eukprot:CAMPEP_0181317028 /NCGR_PEP_ID=MMETSP1101-20121128/16210_1 /TAXON_ID=46948 /ORGANISM="Rhodomonas abbreviata, Strain Caron Lab Isolate" /LENGTH=323 /DNA_ID=CAMNT_0023424315 /DNA_START=370 /DNA_END=1337 /DNA_ORIENTATION=-